MYLIVMNRDAPNIQPPKMAQNIIFGFGQKRNKAEKNTPDIFIFYLKNKIK